MWSIPPVKYKSAKIFKYLFIEIKFYNRKKNQSLEAGKNEDNEFNQKT